MYITNVGYTYHQGTEQHHSRAPFLILMMDETLNGACKAGNVRAIVRRVALGQCGQWMMGTTRILDQRLILSGAYGADGLIKDVPLHVFKEGILLPADLYSLWNHGGGHNSGGSESSAMRAWAVENLTNGNYATIKHPKCMICGHAILRKHATRVSGGLVGAECCSSRLSTGGDV